MRSIEEIEVAILEVEAAIRVVEADISETDSEIKELKERSAEAAFLQSTDGRNEVIELQKEKDRLWRKEEQLRRKEEQLRREKELLLERALGQPGVEPSATKLMEDIMEMMKQMSSSIAGTCEGFLSRIARNQGWMLKLNASTASSSRVKELLRRIALDQSQDQSIPCCVRLDQLPGILKRFTRYDWSGGEASASEVEKGRKWLEKYLCPAGVVVIRVQSQNWLEVNFMELDASISASKSDFLFALDSPAVRALPSNPTPEQLVGILRDIVGAYETKTSRHLYTRGLMSVWPQVVVEALALNHMAGRSESRYFIPVFGGDFTQNLVVHAAPRGDDFVLHAATSVNPGSTEVEVRYMKYLLQQTKTAIEETRRRDEDGDTSVTVLGSARQYDLNKRGMKRGRQFDGGDEDDGERDDGSRELDADESMQLRENAYHRDLVDLLRHPRMYKALGLDEPPKTIAHSTLEERINSMRVIETSPC